MKTRGVFTMICILLLQSPSSGFAERMKAILEDGILELEGGERIVLAGIQLTPEAAELLPILVSNKEVELEYEDFRSKDGDSGKKPASAYLFVKTLELDLPFDKEKGARKNKVMVNEFLLSIGAASVTKEADFKRKNEFIQLESRAREEGQGMWSYETA